MVSLPSKFKRWAHPPITLCSTHVHPLKPKSCRRDGMSTRMASSTDRSNALSIKSRHRRLSVATVVGYHTCTSSVSRNVTRPLNFPLALIWNTGVCGWMHVPSGSASSVIGKKPLHSSTIASKRSAGKG